MTRNLMLAALLTSACEMGPPNCLTTCGMGLYDAEADCDAFQAAETRSLTELNYLVAAWTQSYLCSQVRGFGVYTRDTGATSGWHNPWTGREDNGYTICRYGTIEVAKRSRWQETSLAHELVHVSDGCRDPDHRTWPAMEFQLAIDKANQEPWVAPPSWTTDD